MISAVEPDEPASNFQQRDNAQGAHLSDGTQLAEREPAKVFNDLAETPGVEITIKRKSSDLMHLKSYQIDGRLLRTGAANFSASGLKRQDNDLIVIESPGAAAAFKQTYEARFASGEAPPVGPG